MAGDITAAVDSDTMLKGGDIAVVIIYFMCVIALGIFASCRASRGTVSGYFLAGRSMVWVMVGASLFVSNIGSEHFIGLAGSGASGGIGVGAWEFNAILLLQLLGFVFLPVYIACQTYTMPEYLSKRFGGERLRVYFAVLSLILYIFTKCSVDLYTGAIFIQQSLGWDIYLSIFILIVIVALLTITGGLTAVIYTDTLQAFLMVFGAFFLMGIGFKKVGGFSGLWEKYPQAMANITVANNTCHVPNEKWNVMLRDPSDPDMPWPGFLLGQTPGSIWYWCTDQVIVQRALAAKSLSHAQGATIMAAFIKILPLFFMVMPGMISRVLYANEVACVDPDECWRVCQSHAGCSNIAYPKLVLGIMPTGLRGLMMAVMIAALMSDLDSIFNSSSTLFTIDVWKRIRKTASVREMMIVGRCFTVVMTGVAIAWVPVVKEMQGGQVFIYIQEITDYLAPPVAMIFLLGIFWKRCNEQGAFWALMVTLVMGLTRLILIFVYRPPERCGEPDTRPSIVKDVHYMYFAMMLSVVATLVAVVVSYCTDPPEPKYLLRTTFWTRHDRRTEEDLTSGYQFNQSHKTTQTGTGTEEEEIHVPPPGAVGYVNPALALDESDIDAQIADVGVAGNFRSLPEAPSGQPDKREQPNQEAADEHFTLKERFYEWLCGVSGEGAANEEANRKAVQREQKISTLKQDPTAKLALTVLLFTVLTIGIVLYCFWSLWVSPCSYERYTTNNGTTVLRCIASEK